MSPDPSFLGPRGVPLFSAGERLVGNLFEAEGFGIRRVGGCVRDWLLDVEAKDIDLCTDASVPEMLALAAKHGFVTDEEARAEKGRASPKDENRRRIIKTGLDHGTLTFKVGDEAGYEITMLRTDAATDGRHATVAHTRNWKDDAERRDLTVNQMSMDRQGGIYDYFGGRQDLADRMIRLVGDPDERPRQDYLRILRLYRMYEKLAAGEGPAPRIDPKTEAAVARNVDGLPSLSSERIWMEMAKILAGRNAATLVERMEKLGVVEAIGMPWQDRASAAAATSRGASALGVLSTQVAFPGGAEAIADRWKMSGDEKSWLVFLVAEKRRVSDRRIEDLLVDGKPRAWVVDLARVAGEGEARALSFLPPQFPVQGKDLLAELGMTPGPEVGKTLRQMREAWVSSRFTLEREQMLAPFRPPVRDEADRGRDDR
jgi:tRNA nucleotidyltransferase/poly(A) polymerase